MRPEDSLKYYINFFQNQLSKISNYGKEVSTLAFVSGLQVTHPLYKHLLKHNVSKMSEVLSRAQPCIQLEEAINASSNYPTKPSDRSKVEVNSRSSQPRFRLALGAASLQEAGTPYPLSESNSELQANSTIHSIKASDIWSVQHLQRSAMSQTPKVDLAQFLTARVRGVLLLPQL